VTSKRNIDPPSAATVADDNLLAWCDPVVRIRSPIGPRATAGTGSGAVGDIIGERGVDLRITLPNAPRSGTQNSGSDLPRWPIASRCAAQDLVSENQPIERR
jgi:hypothetical protein